MPRRLDGQAARELAKIIAAIVVAKDNGDDEGADRLLSSAAEELGAGPREVSRVAWLLLFAAQSLRGRHRAQEVPHVG